MSRWEPHDSLGAVEIPDLSFGRGKVACLNCGEFKRDTFDGWCRACSSETVPESPCQCGCRATAPPSAYVDFWEPRSDDK